MDGIELQLLCGVGIELGCGIFAAKKIRGH